VVVVVSGVVVVVVTGAPVVVGDGWVVSGVLIVVTSRMVVVEALSDSPVQAARIKIRETRPPVRRWDSTTSLQVMCRARVSPGPESARQIPRRPAQWRAAVRPC
jgi:hypothetical protein